MSGIFVVFPKIEDAKKIRDVLTRHGFDGVTAFSAGYQALAALESYPGGIVICGNRMRDMNYTELLASLPRGFELLLLASPLVLDGKPPDVLGLALPLRVQELISTVRMMVERSQRSASPRRKKKERTEKERNYIRNAKFLLMEQNHLSEEEAHRYLQKCSMDSGTNMVEAAQMILMLLYDSI